MTDWIAIFADAIPTARAVEFLSDPSAGATSIFLGTTRLEKNAAGQDLVALDYEAYEQMALRQLQDLARQARARWPVAKLALLHRVGRVDAGQASVMIGVSTPHRADAFEACRFLVDAMKAQAAIWKKEIWADGSTRWIEA